MIKQNGPVVLGFQAWKNSALTVPATYAAGGYGSDQVKGSSVFFAATPNVNFQASDLLITGNLAPAWSIASARSNGRRGENMLSEGPVSGAAFDVNAVRRYPLKMQPTVQNSQLIVEATCLAAGVAMNLAAAGSCFGCQGPESDAPLFVAGDAPVPLGFGCYTDKALSVPNTNVGPGGFKIAAGSTAYFSSVVETDFLGYDTFTTGNSADLLITSVRSNGKRRENMLSNPGLPAQIFDSSVARRWGLKMWPTERNATIVIEVQNPTAADAYFGISLLGSCFSCNA